MQAACHSERSRGILLNHQRVASRDFSTTLRSAEMIRSIPERNVDIARGLH